MVKQIEKKENKRDRVHKKKGRLIVKNVLGADFCPFWETSGTDEFVEGFFVYFFNFHCDFVGRCDFPSIQTLSISIHFLQSFMISHLCCLISIYHCSSFCFLKTYCTILVIEFSMKLSKVLLQSPISFKN